MHKATEDHGTLDAKLRAEIAWVSARNDRAWYALGHAKQRLVDLGMSMDAIYGLDAPAAFDLLKWRSQESNIKLRRLAQQLVEDFRDVRDTAIGSQSAFDHVLLTGDVRVVGDGDEAVAPAAN